MKSTICKQNIITNISNLKVKKLKKLNLVEDTRESTNVNSNIGNHIKVNFSITRN